MKKRQEILSILNEIHMSDAIGLIESIGKELRRKNSIRINNEIEHKTLDLREIFNLQTLKKIK